MSISQNFLVDSLHGLLDKFTDNTLRFGRTIKVCLLFNIDYTKDKIIELFKSYNYTTTVYEDIIQIKKQLNNKEIPKLEKITKNLTDFMPDLKKKDLKKKEEELKDKIANFEKENFFIGYISFISDNFVICITTNRTEVVKRDFFNHFVNKVQGFSKLWFSYQLMDDFLVNLRKERHEFIIEELSAVYSKYFRLKSKIRPYKNKDFLLKSEDTEETYYEIKDNYGVCPKRYKINFTQFGEIKINKSNSIIQISKFNPDLLIKNLIPWIYNRSYEYISKILDFKIKQIIDPITEIKNTLSNYLIFDYNSVSELSLVEIIKEIRANPSYSIITQFQNDEKDIEIKINENISGSIMNMYLTNHKVYFTMEEGVAYDAVYPALNILDQRGELIFSIDH